MTSAGFHRVGTGCTRRKGGSWRGWSWRPGYHMVAVPSAENMISCQPREIHHDEAIGQSERVTATDHDNFFFHYNVARASDDF